MLIKAPSSVSSVMRRSSSSTPSDRNSVQSPPPGKTVPRSRGPWKVPLVIGAMTRVPCGTAPSFCGGGTTTWSVMSRRDVIGFELSQPLERRAQLGGEQLRLLPRGEVPALGGLVEIDQVLIGPADPGLRRLIGVFLEIRDRHRQRELGRLPDRRAGRTSSLVFPIQA